MRTIAKEVKDQYMKMGARFRKWFARIFHFENISSFISLRGFFVSFLIGLLLVGAGKLIFWMIQPWLRQLRGHGSDRSSMTPGILFYRRLAQLLAELKLERSPSETQSEFARRAQEALAAKGPQSEAVADVPREVVDAFYRIRFGHLQLDPESLDAISRRLDALELRLKSP
jgi:hypothetical protein